MLLNFNMENYYALKRYASTEVVRITGLHVPSGLTGSLAVTLTK